MLERYNDLEGFKVVPYSDNRLFININGRLIGEFNDKIVIEKDKDDNLIFLGTINNKKTYYKVALVICLIFKNIKIPVEQYDKIEVMYLNGDKNNVHPSNLIYKFINGGVIDNNYPTAKIIPMFTNYVIYPDGKVRLRSNEAVLVPYITKNGYVLYNIQPDVGPVTKYPRHRLLGLVYIEYYNNVEDLVINHINGIPGCDTLDNLEWVTKQENLVHAFETGLRTDNIPIMSRNVITGEIKHYYSYGDCARDLKIDPVSVFLRISMGDKVLYSGNLQFKRQDDLTPWYEFTEEGLAEALKNRGWAEITLCKHIGTEEVKEFPSIAECAKFVGASSSNVARYLRTGSKKPINGYDFVIYSKGVVWPIRTAEQVRFYLRPENMIRTIEQIAVLTLNTKTGEIKHYDTVYRCAKELKVSGAAILGRLEASNGIIYKDGFRVKRADSEIPWVPETVYSVRSGSEPIFARHIKTGEVLKYVSIEECGRALNLNSNSIKYCIRNDKSTPLGGYNFSKVKKDIIWPTYTEEEIEYYLNNTDRYAPKKVKVVDTLSKSEDIFISLKTAASNYNVSPRVISSSILNKRLFSKKYIASWAE